MNTPSRFETTPEQAARNACGIAACRAVLEPILARRAQPDTPTPLTPSEEIHQRAKARAVAEKRSRRIEDLDAIGVVLARDVRLPARSAS